MGDYNILFKVETTRVTTAQLHLQGLPSQTQRRSSAQYFCITKRLFESQHPTPCPDRPATLLQSHPDRTGELHFSSYSIFAHACIHTSETRAERIGRKGTKHTHAYADAKACIPSSVYILFAPDAWRGRPVEDPGPSMYLGRSALGQALYCGLRAEYCLFSACVERDVSNA